METETALRAIPVSTALSKGIWKGLSLPGRFSYLRFDYDGE